MELGLFGVYFSRMERVPKGFKPLTSPKSLLKGGYNPRLAFSWVGSFQPGKRFWKKFWKSLKVYLKKLW